MRIYHYEDFNDCYIYGSIGGNIEKFVSNVIDKLHDISDYKKPTHPKELERQERLRQQQNEGRGRNVGNFEQTFGLTSIKPKFLKRKNNELTNCVMIVNGNFGFGTKDIKYFTDKLESLNELLGKNNVHLLLVRGNLDDPQVFDNEVLSLSNIKAIPDYSVIMLKDYNCLCIGGSISIDREWKKIQQERLGRKMYWDNEGFQYKEEELNEILDKYDIACVVTSICPSFSFPGTNTFNKSIWAVKDKTLLADILSERKLMDRMYEKFIEKDKKPYVWAYSAYMNDSSSANNDIIFQSFSKFSIHSLQSIISTHFGFKLGEKTKVNKHPIDNLIEKISNSIKKRYIDVDEEENIGMDVEEGGDFDMPQVDIPVVQDANFDLPQVDIPVVQHANMDAELARFGAQLIDEFNYGAAN